MISILFATANIKSNKGVNIGIISGESDYVQAQLTKRGYVKVAEEAFKETWINGDDIANVTMELFSTTPGTISAVERIANAIVAKKRHAGVGLERALDDTEYEIEIHKDFWPGAFRQAYQNACYETYQEN